MIEQQQFVMQYEHFSKLIFDLLFVWRPISWRTNGVTLFPVLPFLVTCLSDSRIIYSIFKHLSTFDGRGKPWVRIAVSHATIGRFSYKPYFTSRLTPNILRLK
jgi:hypothetical protein